MFYMQSFVARVSFEARHLSRSLKVCLAMLIFHCAGGIDQGTENNKAVHCFNYLKFSSVLKEVTQGLNLGFRPNGRLRISLHLPIKFNLQCNDSEHKVIGY